jgi:hypothetical protein
MLRHLRCLFFCFEVVSGLEINLAKSKLVPMGNVHNVDWLASILACRVAFFAFEISWSSVGGFL